MALVALDLIFDHGQLIEARHGAVLALGFDTQQLLAVILDQFAAVCLQRVFTKLLRELVVVHFLDQFLELSEENPRRLNEPQLGIGFDE